MFIYKKGPCICASFFNDVNASGSEASPYIINYINGLRNHADYRWDVTRREIIYLSFRSIPSIPELCECDIIIVFFYYSLYMQP